MKKTWIWIIAILFFFPVSAKALSAEEAANKMNELLLNLITNEEWQVKTNKKSKDRYDIEIEVGNTTDEEFNELINMIPYYSWFNHDAYKSSVLLTNCKNTKNCDKNDFDYVIRFQLSVKDNRVYLLADMIEDRDYKGIQNAELLHYTVTTNQKWWGDDITKEGTISQIGKQDEEGVDKTVGRFSNPQIIKLKGTVKVPPKKDSFWDGADENKCYYIKFDYSKKSNNTIARYKITPAEEVQQNIYWADDPVYFLASTLTQDAVQNELFQVSKNNIYAICNSYGEEYSFSYHDDESINVGNHIQQQESDRQNGEDTSNLLTEEEIKKAREAIAGAFKPDVLCGENNENCNLDITKFCTNRYVARTLKFLGLLLYIAKIFVPAIIIVLGFVDLVKIVTSGKIEDAKKQGMNIIRRGIIGIIIFLIPTILVTVYNAADRIANGVEESEEASGELEAPEDFKNCIYCILDPGKCLVIEENMGE